MVQMQVLIEAIRGLNGTWKFEENPKIGTLLATSPFSHENGEVKRQAIMRPDMNRTFCNLRI